MHIYWVLKHTILCSCCEEYFINKGISISKWLKIWMAKHSTDWSTLVGAQTLNDCLGKAMIWRIGSTRKTWLTAINGEEPGVWDAIIDKPNENSSNSSTTYKLGSLQVYGGTGKEICGGEERQPWQPCKQVTMKMAPNSYQEGRKGRRKSKFLWHKLPFMQASKQPNPMQPQGTQLQTAKIPGLPCSQLEGVLVTSIALIFNLA